MKHSTPSLLLKIVLTMQSGVRAFRVVNAGKSMSGSPFAVSNGSRSRSMLHAGWTGNWSRELHKYSSLSAGCQDTLNHSRGVFKDSTLSLTQKERKFGIKRYQSSPYTNLSALRGGENDNSRVSVVRLPSSFSQVRSDDVSTAILAVLASCRVTRLLQPTGHVPRSRAAGSPTRSITTLSKSDASPVTVGDFASQAMVLKILHEKFPCDIYIAEEGSEALRNDEDLLEIVWNSVKIASSSMENICSWKNRHELLDCIDYGQGLCPSNKIVPTFSKRRVWCLDPIDGTKGFLRGRIEGGQYCVALALIEDGVPVVSILGCPNQPIYSRRTSKITSKKDPYGAWSEDEVQVAEKQFPGVNEMENLFSFNRGCIFVAVHGCGCYEISIRDLEQSLFCSSKSHDTAMWRQLHVTPSQGTSKSPSCAKFCLGVERDFSDPEGTVLKIAQRLHGEDALTTEDGIPDIRNSIRMDGQGKYGILARGEAEYFLRLPKSGYRDWVWDVAAGYLILTEAGGKMTDINGDHIDFSGIGVDRMAKLSENVKGLLASCGGVFHDSLLSAYASVERS